MLQMAVYTYIFPTSILPESTFIYQCSKEERVICIQKNENLKESNKKFSMICGVLL